MARQKMTRINSRRICPMCNGKGILFDDLENLLAKNISLHEQGKIKHGEMRTNLYDYLFAKYGFTPSLSEAMTIFDIKSLEIYSKIFIPRMQKIGLAYLKSNRASRENSKKRRMYILQTDDGTITEESVTEILRKQNYLCAICGISIEEKAKRHMDHKMPLSKNGKHTIANIQWLCVKCNVTKSNNIFI